MADDLGKDPAVPGAEDADWRRSLIAIAGRHAVGRDDDRRRVRKQRSCEIQETDRAGGHRTTCKAII